MGYNLRGIITSIESLNFIRDRYQNLCMIHLYKNLLTVPITDEFYDEINMNKGTTFKNNEYLTDFIGLFCSEISKVSRTAYIEADYFGGLGTQNGIIWDSEKVIYEETLNDNAINRTLEQLGIIRVDGKDEFDTVNLGRHRFIDDWVNKEIHF